MKTKTIARVQVTIEVEASAPWDETCTTAQVFKQAKDDALQKIAALKTFSGTPACLRVVGEPKVLAVTTEKES